MSHQHKTKPKRATHPAKSLVHKRMAIEFYQLPAMIEKSYLLSSIWAWLSRIQIEPDLRIPVPRILTTRDP